MKLSGSIVLKKTDLLTILDDERIIFNNENVSKSCKWFSFGRSSLIQDILVHNGIREGFDWSHLGLTLFGYFWDKTIADICEKPAKEK